MKLPLALHVRARADLVDAALWYERARAGWSEEFETCLDAALTTVSERPKSFPVVRQDVRRALVGRFPYAVYFRQMRDHILVLAILHTSRSPRVWQDRVRDR